MRSLLLLIPFMPRLQGLQPQPQPLRLHATTPSARFHHHRSLRSSSSSTNADLPEPFPDLVVFDLDMCAWSPEMYLLDEVPAAGKSEIRGRLYPDDEDPTFAAMEGVVGAKSGYETIRLFPQTRRVLRDYWNDEYPPNLRLAAASSADTPLAVRIGRGAMTLLEVLPGVTVEDCFRKGWEASSSSSSSSSEQEGGGGAGAGGGGGGAAWGEENLQVGRTLPLSSDKSKTHFPILKEKCGVPFHRMLFFDDSVWSDHCRIVSSKCKERVVVGGGVDVGEWGVVAQKTPNGLTASEWAAGLNKYAQQAAAIAEKAAEAQ